MIWFKYLFNISQYSVMSTFKDEFNQKLSKEGQSDILSEKEEIYNYLF